MKSTKYAKFVALLALPVMVLSACSAPADKLAESPSAAATSEAAAASPTPTAEASASADTTAKKDGEIKFTNCGVEMTLPGTAEKMYVNDGNIIALALAVGAADKITAVSSLNRDIPVLKEKYGEVVEKLNNVSDDYPTMESILANTPDLVVAGWNYGFSEGKNLTPDLLMEKGIPSYILTESCRQEGSTKRGIVDPWEAVRMDLTNLGMITGNEDKAKEVVGDMEARLKVLDEAPKPEKAPVVFVFDSAKDTIFTSGSFGAPEAIINKAGGVNANGNLEDTWTTVTWEALAANEPDVFAFVEYPGQSWEEKVEILKTHPVTKDLDAVKNERFVNLPYALWCESPLNIDAAEYLRKSFEQFGFAPASDVKISLPLPAEMPGLDKLPKVDA